MSFAIGVDYGTNSARALIVDTGSGQEVSHAVYDYQHGDEGILLDPKDPNVARQSPQDYIDGFLNSVKQAVDLAKLYDGFSVDQVVGIGIDTTGSTPLPVDATGTPLGLLDEFSDNLAAQAWLWKDHTSFAEAAEITDKASSEGYPYLAKCGGTYSSEWYWAKILHCLRTCPEVSDAAASWVELCDFVPGYITGTLAPEKIARSVCAAGHKAMYHADWGGLPAVDFLESLESGLAKFRYETQPLDSSHAAGGLTAEVADQVGLEAGTTVAVGAFDAHMGAVGAGCGPGVLVKIIGTSTCDCVVAPGDDDLPDIPGLCGIVPGSIIPGMYGIEAGQSAVGDIFNWFAKHLSPTEFGSGEQVHAKLTQTAAELSPGESGLLALDWNNGNRTVLVDPQLTGLLVGQTLHTTAPEIYRALIEATAFGALAIINRMEEYNVAVTEIVNCGGIAEKNDLLMQIYADVCNRPLKVSRSAQTCALGAAIFGAVADGAFVDVREAQNAMTGVKEKVFEPIAKNVAVYQRLYPLYLQLHDAFGGVEGANHGASLGNIMKELITIRSEVRKDA